MDRLVLWNIDLTLLDVGRVSRDAYADAFGRVTGRPLAALPQLVGRSDTEIFFESLYLNDVPTGTDEVADAELLARYCWELEAAFTLRQDELLRQGRLLPGAMAAVTATAALPGVVQTVLTGSIKPNAVAKLRGFGLDRFFDLEIGGYGSDAYPRGSLLLLVEGDAGHKYGGRSRRTGPCTSLTAFATWRRPVPAAPGLSPSPPGGPQWPSFAMPALTSCCLTWPTRVR